MALFLRHALLREAQTHKGVFGYAFGSKYGLGLLLGCMGYLVQTATGAATGA